MIGYKEELERIYESIEVINNRGIYEDSLVLEELEEEYPHLNEDELMNIYEKYLETI